MDTYNPTDYNPSTQFTPTILPLPTPDSPPPPPSPSPPSPPSSPSSSRSPSPLSSPLNKANDSIENYELNNLKYLLLLSISSILTIIYYI